MNNISIEFSEKKDLERIRALLSECGLPFKHIADPDLKFLLATKEQEIIGTIGFRRLENIGLIRSLSVKNAYRNTGIAKKLYNRLKSYANENNIEKLYILTTTAEHFFKKLGFIKIEKSDIPGSIKNTIEHRKVCPKSSVCMYKSLK